MIRIKYSINLDEQDIDVICKCLLFAGNAYEKIGNKYVESHDVVEAKKYLNYIETIKSVVAKIHKQVKGNAV